MSKQISTTESDGEVSRKLEVLLIMRNRTGIKLEAIVTNSAAMTSGEKSYTALSLMI